MREYARDALAALVASVPAVVTIATKGEPALVVAGWAVVLFCTAFMASVIGVLLTMEDERKER